ncbi:hypothetical protein PUMCH_000289 [Australozyma saopauloensis]|uniref:TATA-binding protein interacting (TIP20) domain-containing protein n=1 Tax=Australozyma saopauloensis TaxID=291208 RepID=A0AAX4H3B4_9ASCO|nr:hypothetical protein PUMCH_000289 [[Candida] saopauloensis]
MTFNIETLEDNCRDVDPDLRYMALQDFQKNLNNPKIQVKGVLSIIPVLFKLLYDPAAEVQNQAIKAFAPLVRHIDDSQTVKVIQQLYTESESSKDISRFATSVPNLALRSLFQNSHARFGKQLSRVIMDNLLPQILQGNMTLSRIEILIDLLQSLGGVLVLEEICAVRNALLVCAFTETGIVSKRSIVAIGVLLGHIKSACSDQTRLQRQFYDGLFSETIALYENENCSRVAKRALFSIFLTVLNHISKLKMQIMSIATAEMIASVMIENLCLSTLNKEQVEDLDLDQMVSENVLRSDVLDSLALLIPCISYEGILEPFLPDIVRILEAFISYDPLAVQNQDDSDYDDDSEIDFSDDDEVEQDESDGADGLASKLRIRSLVAFGQLCYNKSLVLSSIFESNLASQVIEAIGDKSSDVSIEALNCVILLLHLVTDTNSPASDDSMQQFDLTTFHDLFVTKFVPRIEAILFDKLLVPENISNFSHIEALVEPLIQKMSRNLSNNFLTLLVDRLVAQGMSLKSHPELIGLYEVLLETYLLEQIPQAQILVKDLAESLEGLRAYSSSISKYLQVCKVFYHRKPLLDFQCQLANDLFFPAIIKSAISRQFSSDVRQQLLVNLSDLLIEIPISSDNRALAVQTFSETLNYEVTVGYTIDCLNDICERNPEVFDSLQLSNLIIEKLSTYLGSGDSSLYSSSLTLIQTIFQQTKYNGSVEVVQVLSQKILELLKNSADSLLIDKALCALTYVLELQNADQLYTEGILKVVTRFTSLEAEDIKLNTIEKLAAKLSQHNTLGGARLFQMAMSILDLSKFISATFISTIVLECNLFAETELIEAKLSASLDGSTILTEDMIFCIHFLGCMSSHNKVTRFSYEDFFSILENNATESICMASARALGLSIFSEFNIRLPLLLQKYEYLCSINDSKKSLLLISVKQILKQDSVAIEDSSLRLIWDTIVKALSNSNCEMNHNDVAGIKLAGEILGVVAELDIQEDYQKKLLQCFDSEAVKSGNIFIVYAMVVVTKVLLSDSKTTFDEKVIEQVMSNLSKPNLDLKLAIVSTIFTGVYNKSKTIAGIANEMILPPIFDELSAKEEFKKVIPMGPYKYVVDEGLEVRKLSYELINAMIGLSDSSTKDLLFEIDKVKILEMMLAKGLNDSENDIINLAVGNLIEIIQSNPVYLTQISNLHDFIQSLMKILSRNLRAKATTQEAESHGDTLRAIIKLSKVVNKALVSDSALTSEWTNYYNDLKTRHQLLFHATT